ncbi:fimbrial protein [Escherichia coli]|uniref:F4 family fimbrial subunit n=1 Tax=Escherichia coli TaxID=562 RepID=UPI003F482C31
MKKTLLALAVVASTAVSGSAMAAWQTGSFQGNVNFGGTVETTDYSQKWAWMVGTGFDQYVNSIRDIQESNNKYTLTIANQGNNAILLGKTKEAFSTATTGVGAIPNITFADFNGQPLLLKNMGMPERTGKAFIDIPIKDGDSNNQIGSLHLNLVVSGVAVNGSADAPGRLMSLYGIQNYIFNGGIPTETPAVEFADGEIAAAKVNQFGGPSAADLWGQVQAVYPQQTQPYTNATDSTNENMQYSDGTVVAAAYSMGIQDGQNLVATFDNRPAQTLHWSAPLSIIVSYV